MFSQYELRMFDLAIAAAKTSTYNTTRVGAIIVYKRDILAVGVNKHKTHPRQYYYNKFRKFDEFEIRHHYLHAEMDAISKISHIPKGSEIFIARVRKDGTQGMCKPCEGCHQALLDVGIAHRFYTTNEGYSYDYIKK